MMQHTHRITARLAMLNFSTPNDQSLLDEEALNELF